MAIPFSYSLRNLWTRKVTTILTATGMALVVYVFAAVLMLSEGLKKTLRDTGSTQNAIVVRRSADNEVMSLVQRQEASIIETQPEVASGPKGEPLIAREVTVLMALPKQNSEAVGNVTIRGVSDLSLNLRPQVKLKTGRFYRPGSSDIIIGSSIAKRFKGTGLGQVMRFGLREWRVVGIFDAGGSGFDSEIWADADQVMGTFRRTVYSSVVFRLPDPAAFQAVKNRLESDPRLTVTVKREAQFYADQSEIMARFIRILGLSMEGDLGSWAKDCFAYLRERHYTPRMGRVPASRAENLASFPGHRKILDRDNSDYVYLTDNLIRLSGNRYHTYKNHRNRFMKQQAWDYQPLTPNLIGECLNLQEEWCRLRQCFESPSLLSEEQAIIEAFTHLDRLMFKGGVIRVNNKVEAFTLGELLNPKTVVIHFEKANPDLSGLYQVIQQQFLEREWKGIPLVNREQDLGLEGLRKAKQSYHPEFLVEKYSLFLDS